ncbi:MAG TPA: GAF and ANTAR domain-containing protein [Mycobacteriales bacterium]|nr:GAF and ANTAR domain-containing protein [Mycobacteriales bacterium]
MRDQHDDAASMPVAVRALASIMLSDGSRTAVLQRTCEAATAIIPGVEEASVTILGDRPRTVASTGTMATQADEAQYRIGHGPCLEAAHEGRPVLVTDLGEEQRWPVYAREALESGVRASLSVPLEFGGETAGALNLYASRADAFDATMVDTAFDLAHYAGVVATVSDERDRAVKLAEELQQAMQSRAVIEQAKGILMRDRGCTAEEAFHALVRLSQESHQKLRVVATRVVDQATAKGTGADSTSS